MKKHQGRAKPIFLERSTHPTLNARQYQENTSTFDILCSIFDIRFSRRHHSQHHIHSIVKHLKQAQKREKQLSKPTDRPHQSIPNIFFAFWGKPSGIVHFCASQPVKGMVASMPILAVRPSSAEGSKIAPIHRGATKRPLSA